MIKSFASKSAEDLYHGRSTREARKIPQDIWGTACRKLDAVNASNNLNDLRVPPANRLEALRGKFRGKYSIRINRQWRVLFEFREGNAFEVDIVDYH